MSYIGGFLGVYTILLRGGNFGSAQTGNLIYLATGWFGGSWQEMVIRIIALIIFIISMIAAYLLPKYVKGDMRRICIWVEITGIVLAYIQTKDAKQKEKAGFYGITLMSFQIGVLGGFFAVNEWQVAGIWSCLIPLGLALTLVEVDVARKTQAKVVAHRTCSAPDR